MNESTYCKSCGAYIPEGKNKCLACGSPSPIAFERKQCALDEAKKRIDDEPENIEMRALRDVSAHFRSELDKIKMQAVMDSLAETIQEDLQQNKPLCFAANDRHKKGKADIDLDRLLNQELFTVKIGGKVKWFYFGKADMEIGSTIYHTKDLFGRIVVNEKRKNKFHLTLIER